MFFFQLVGRAEFAEVIKEDADSLENRHVTDSVPLVDDIRYHIASNVQTYSAIEEANQKLAILEDMLFQINIECWIVGMVWFVAPKFRTLRSFFQG